MNWDHIEGNWLQYCPSIKQRWDKLTDEQLETVAGKRSHLAHKIQKAYDLSQEDAEQQLAAWEEEQNETAYITGREAERNAAP
jgi:uncharacterized protein YjbJ (UPF0337 family)